MKGIFIVLEGPDGSGKSTMAKKIGEYYREKGREIEFTREPGGTDISEKIREIILNNDNTEMDYKTEALLYAAARAQLVSEKIIPWLKGGKIVISERYIYSSFAYQGIGRGLGIEKIKEINSFATEDLMPNIVFFLDVNPERGLKRKLNMDGGDRLENEDVSFHKQVYDGYKALAKLYPEIKIINAERTIEEIFFDIKEVINLIS